MFLCAAPASAFLKYVDEVQDNVKSVVQAGLNRTDGHSCLGFAMSKDFNEKEEGVEKKCEEECRDQKGCKAFTLHEEGEKKVVHCQLCCGGEHKQKNKHFTFYEMVDFKDSFTDDEDFMFMEAKKTRCGDEIVAESVENLAEMAQKALENLESGSGFTDAYERNATKVMQAIASGDVPSDGRIIIGKFDVFLSSNTEKYYFFLRGMADQILLSSKAYDSKEVAIDAVHEAQISTQIDQRYEKSESNGEFIFSLKDGEGALLGTSSAYVTAATRDNGIADVKRYAYKSEIQYTASQDWAVPDAGVDPVTDVNKPLDSVSAVTSDLPEPSKEVAVETVASAEPCEICFQNFKNKGKGKTISGCEAMTTTLMVTSRQYRPYFGDDYRTCHKKCLQYTVCRCGGSEDCK